MYLSHRYDFMTRTSGHDWHFRKPRTNERNELSDDARMRTTLTRRSRNHNVNANPAVCPQRGAFKTPTVEANATKTIPRFVIRIISLIVTVLSCSDRVILTDRQSITDTRRPSGVSSNRS